ncbi:MAG: pyrroline-5-carboxylate reductase [Candidatus Methylopumilus sp.]|nr:pyrroline-5-carboxylate reductase [Candidatus Methylopumilus sp.]
MNICFLGGGNMARAMISGLLNKNYSPTLIRVIELDHEKRISIENDFKILVQAEFKQIVIDEIIVLAVKPQQAEALLKSISNQISKQLILSIAAGIQIQSIEKWINGYTNIVRSMPNMCAQIQLGITALFTKENLTAKNKDAVEVIAQAIGEFIWLDNESKMDAVTAVSGSGPAYVFYFLNAFIESAMELGLSRKEAEKLCSKTFLGASYLAKNQLDNLQNLISSIASKGGTTEEALKQLELNKLNETLSKATRAAYEKSKKLGLEFN